MHQLEAMSSRVSEQQRVIDQMRGESEGSLLDRERSSSDSERLILQLSAAAKERKIELCMVKDQNKAQWKLIEALEAEQGALKSDLATLSQQSRDHLERASKHQQVVQASILQSNDFISALTKSVERMDFAVEESEVSKRRASELEIDKIRAAESYSILKREMQGQVDRINHIEERLLSERRERREMMDGFQKEKDLLSESLAVQRDQRAVIFQLRKEREDERSLPPPLPPPLSTDEVQRHQEEGGVGAEGVGAEDDEGGSLSADEGVDVTEMQIEVKGEGGGSEAISPPSDLLAKEPKANADDLLPAPAAADDDRVLAEGGSQRKKPRLLSSGQEPVNPYQALIGEGERAKGEGEGRGGEMDVGDGGWI